MIINGNILDAEEKYIVHQCNCVTNEAAFLAKSVFERFPYADVYSNRKQCDQPGEIAIRGNGTDQRYVIALFGQYYPGKSTCKKGRDTVEDRKQYFISGLTKILSIPNLDSIAFPYGIGCGAAGGDWNAYKKIIEKFDKVTPAKVTIYRLS